MSFPYKKEISESVLDGSIKAVGLLGTAYLMGKEKPTISPTFMNFLKIGGIIGAIDVAYDYAKYKKWIP